MDVKLGCFRHCTHDYDTVCMQYYEVETAEYVFQIVDPGLLLWGVYYYFSRVFQLFPNSRPGSTILGGSTNLGGVY